MFAALDGNWISDHFHNEYFLFIVLKSPSFAAGDVCALKMELCKQWVQCAVSQHKVSLP